MHQACLGDWPLRGDEVLINEIMFHASPAVPEDSGQEWIELLNNSSSAVDLNGWRFSKGITFTFSNVTIAPGAYLVVAADLAKFSARYPGVTNVVGNWSGRLSNNGDELQLDNAAGQMHNEVAYASEGDWAMRQRGPNSSGHYGWIW